jgi:hypothetical protein
MKHSASKHLALIRHILLLVGASFIVTVGSYAVVTDRNVPLDPVKGYHTLSRYAVILPCGDPGFSSSEPILPEARGLPFNYNFYDPCVDKPILINWFIIDFIFWSIVLGILYITYLQYRKKGK